MTFLYESALSPALSVVLAGVAGLSLVLCIQRFRTARRHAGEYLCAAYVLRGIRWLVIALTAAAWSASLYWSAGWLFIIGLVFIGQELYECAFLSAALREGVKIDRAGKHFP